MEAKYLSRVFVFFMLLMFAILSIKQVKAFDCSGGSNTVTVDIPPTILYVNISPITVNKNANDILLTDMSNYASCSGSANTYYQNALRSTSLSISSTLTALGYSAYLVSGSINSSSPPDVCLWPDSSCSMDGTTSSNVKAKIRLQRSAHSGDWHVGTVIHAGTEIARMETEARDVGSKYVNAPWHPVTWIFRLNADMVIPAYTCNITQYDKSVTLPDVSRTALQSHGNGRYPDVKKEFQFALNCDASTAVSVTFEGDVLSDTDNVLKNAYSGNDNIGIQMLFSDNTPVKLGTKYPVTSSAQTSEILKLNAYYYYKGGDVSGGPIKANTTFMFDYQ